MHLSSFGREQHGRPDALVSYVQSWVEITDSAVLATNGKSHHPIVQPSANSADEVPDTAFAITEVELQAADA